MESSRRETVSLLHHYVGDDSVAMDAVVDAIESRLDVRIDGTGDAAVSLTAKTDLLRGDPPDVWDDWPGRNVRPYLDAGVVADVTDLWEEAGFTDAFLDHARQSATVDGRYYALPTNVQRQNNLFFNVDLFEAAGVDPDGLTDPASLLGALETVEAETDARGLLLPQKRPWPTFDLWDMAVLAESDAATYDAIFRGGAAASNRAVVRDALAFLADVQAYVPADATYDDWQAGLRRFVDGDAAAFCMGDWAAGVLDGLDDVAYGEDWASVPFPGTGRVYQVVMDALFTPTTAAHPDAAREVLRAFGSADVLEQFTRERGAVPPRSDCSVSGHSAFFQEQRSAYRRSDAQVSATRGLGVRPAYRVELLTEMATFIDEGDVEATTDAVVDALSD